MVSFMVRLFVSFSISFIVSFSVRFMVRFGFGAWPVLLVSLLVLWLVFLLVYGYFVWQVFG